jgi:hypothetical protein
MSKESKGQSLGTLLKAALPEQRFKVLYVDLKKAVETKCHPSEVWSWAKAQLKGEQSRITIYPLS